MRITNNIMSRAQFDGLAASMAALQRAQAQATTGKRMLAASDDPSASMQVMQSDTALRALDQYRTNIQRASSRVAIEDSVLDKVGNLVTRAKELGMAQSSSTASSQTRQVANAEVQQLFSEIVSLGNTKFGNEYMFGGDQSQTAPFAVTGSGATLDFTTTNPQSTRMVAIDEGQTVATSLDGKQLLLDTGVLDAMKALSAALDPASPTYGQAGISAAMNKLDGAFQSLQTVVGGVGARGKQLESTQQNLDAYKTNLTTFKSNLEDIDVEEAVTELTNRQLAYQAAMLATSKVLGQTLADYLR